MRLIEKLETDAKAYMAKTLKKEDRFSKELLNIVNEMEREILLSVKTHDNISISFIESFIMSEIVPIIEGYKSIQYDYIEDSIINQFNNGINHADSLLDITPYEKDIDKLINSESEYYEEVLFALLLYTRKLIDSLNSDLSNKIYNDVISSYIMAKKQNGSAINDIIKKNKEDKTVSSVLSGAAISVYIKSTFKNIKTRADFIARTETNRALNHGHMLGYVSAGIELVKWVEINDGKICRNCQRAAAFNNGIYRVNMMSPPPLHPNCRCTLVPFEIAWKDLQYYDYNE